MDVLVAFATTEGQTKKIAHHIESLITGLGNTCSLHDCQTNAPAADPASFDAVLVAGSVHQKEHQPALAEFVKTNRAALSKKPTAFISVSLAITTPEGEREALQYVEAFSTMTGWVPDEIHLAAGAIRFLEYDFFKEFTVKQIVLRGGEMPDKAAGNPEYTDWAALDVFVASFVATALTALSERTAHSL